MNLGTRLVVGILTLYRRLISPVLPAACRFYPSCSCYAIESFKKYGVVRGTLLTLRRLAKCHPFHPGGYDPVR
jgi:putative membrane protein insertion efficiency factor